MLTKFIRLSILPVALIALAMPALADSDKGNSGKAPPGQSGKLVPSVGTPPGLAKKPLNMPPGQAKKIYRAGEHLPNGYTWIDDLGRWRLPRSGRGKATFAMITRSTASPATPPSSWRRSALSLIC